MKHFKFKTTMKVDGYRSKTLQGIAATKKRVTAKQAAEMINGRITVMTKEGLKEAGEFPDNIINSFKFKTTAEALPFDYFIDLDNVKTLKKNKDEEARF